MSENRLNAYRIMWLFVFFDLPVITKKERKIATIFRKGLVKDGFVMMQFSVYIRHCASKESQDVHIMRVTDKQYGDIINYWGKEKKKKKEISEPLQLVFFNIFAVTNYIFYCFIGASLSLST